MSKVHKDYLKHLLASVRRPQAASISSFKPSSVATKLSSAKDKPVVTFSPKGKRPGDKPKTANSTQSSQGTALETSAHRAKVVDEPTDTGIEQGKCMLAGDSSLNRILTEKLKELGRNYDIERRFRVFQGMFAAVIGLDTHYCILLKRIKSGYEEYLSHTSHSDVIRENEEIHTQLLEYQALLEQEQYEKQTLKGSLETLTRELTDRVRELNEKEELLKAVSTQYHSDSSKSFHSVSRLEMEISLLRKRENLFLGVLKTAQRRGFPVEELLSDAPHRKTASGASTDYCQAASWALLPMPVLSADLHFDQASPISPIGEEAQDLGKGPDSSSSFSKAAEMFPLMHRE